MFKMREAKLSHRRWSDKAMNDDVWFWLNIAYS